MAGKEEFWFFGHFGSQTPRTGLALRQWKLYNISIRLVMGSIMTLCSGSCKKKHKNGLPQEANIGPQ